jgi:outer membrane lipoprotein-sorting protein
MSLLRTLPTGRLIALLVAVAAIAAGGTAIALGAVGGGPVPRAKPLARAVHDAVAAPDINGITARITFTNKLIDSSSLQGGGPLLKGAKGRLWLGDGKKLRLELQTDNGDAQIVSDGVNAWVYDSGSHTVYRGKLPQDKQPAAGKTDGKIPTLAEVQKSISELAKTADLSRATPGNVAGRPAYTVRISPKHDGGLLGAGALAWDAAKGVPLRAAVYAQGSNTPVLELKAEHIKFGKVPASAFAVSPPADAKVVNVDVPSSGAPGANHDSAGKGKEQAVTGVGAVSKAVPFKLSAPATLVGLPRHEVRLVDWKGKKAAVVTYGQDLGGMVVIEQPAEPAAKPAAPSDKHGDHGGGLTLPKVSINGTTGEELDTALATMIRFQRGGVAYTVLGSVPPAAAQAAARGL